MKIAYILVSALVIIFLIWGGYYLWQRSETEKEAQGPITNIQMLLDGDDTPIVRESNVQYFSGANGYFVRPEAEGNYPGIVMIHENRGLRPEIKAMAELLARKGYMVLAVDLFGGVVVETQDQARALTDKYDQKKGIENLNAAVSYLKDEGATKIASLGWCFGGGQSLQLALSGQVMDATVIYYGRLATTTAALAPIKWPVLGIFGAEDQSISVESVRQFESSLNTLGTENEIYIYPGVGHAFANPSGMNYAPEATKDAWGKTITFLENNLK